MPMKHSFYIILLHLNLFTQIYVHAGSPWATLEQLRRSRFTKRRENIESVKRTAELETLLKELRQRRSYPDVPNSAGDDYLYKEVNYFPENDVNYQYDYTGYKPPNDGYDFDNFKIFPPTERKRQRKFQLDPSKSDVDKRSDKNPYPIPKWVANMNWENPDYWKPKQNHDFLPPPSDYEPRADNGGDPGNNDKIYQENDHPTEHAEGVDEKDENEGDFDRNFRYHVPLDSKGDLQLFWDVDTPTEVITFRLQAKVHKSDVLAFGFSDYGEATGADLIVMWTDRNGKHFFQDMHTDEQGRLLLDDTQNYMLDDVIIQDGRMNLIFHRQFDTCDDNDYMIDTGTTHIIFFSKPGVQKSMTRFDVTSVDVGLQRVQLLKSQLPDPPLPADTFDFVMHVDNIEIPAVETTYWFATKKLPELPDKHHIVKFEGAISPDSVGIVHHMEVFHCEVPAGHTLPEFNEPSSSNEGRPRGLESCRQVIGAWAMGAEPLAYPSEAGAPIGGPGYSRYVMLEVHFNNPDGKKGVIDSSGIRFYVTRELRQHDAGIMEIGVEYTDKMALPPGQPGWDLVGYCIPECTSVGLPDGGIKIFAAQLHTHLTGRTTYTEHYRGGAQLPDMNRDNHYSPHYQEIRKLHRQVTVLPGDSLVHVCQDRTTDRKNITLGGFAISDEMCVTYVHYYPKTELEVCKSSVTTKSLYGFFDFLNRYNHQPTSREGAISENYKSVDWSPVNVNFLRRYYDTAPISMQCNQSDGSRFPGEWEGRPIPDVLYPLPPPERPCLL